MIQSTRSAHVTTVFLKLFLCNNTFLYPLKTSENLSYSLVFRGYKVVTLENSELRSSTAKDKVKIMSPSIVRLAYIVLNHRPTIIWKKKLKMIFPMKFFKISGYIERMDRVIKTILVISTCTFTVLSTIIFSRSVTFELYDHQSMATTYRWKLLGIAFD